MQPFKGQAAVSILVEAGEIAPQTHPYSIYKDPGKVGDFRYCVLRKVLTPETDVSNRDYRTLNAKYAIRRAVGTPALWFGLENSSVTYEYVPLFTRLKTPARLERLPFKAPEEAAKTDAGASGSLREAAMASLVAPVSAQPKPDVDEDSDIFSADMDAELAEMEQQAEETLIGGETAQFRAFSADDETEAEAEEADAADDELEQEVDAIMDELSSDKR